MLQRIKILRKENLMVTKIMKMMMIISGKIKHGFN